MSKSKTEVIYHQMGRIGIIGRVVSTRGGLEAQVSTMEGDWQRADARQAARLFRNALSVNLLTPGSEVVAWEGSRLVRGHYIGVLGGLFEVSAGGRLRNHFTTQHVMPLSAAVKEGLWPFRRGMAVAAYVDEKWVQARWINYAEGEHEVELRDGTTAQSDRVHIAADAINLGLLES